MNAAPRLAQLRESLEGSNHALVVSYPANIAWLTGFEGVFDDEDAHAAVVTVSDAVLYTDSRYAAAAESQAGGTPWAIKQATANLYDEVCEDLAVRGIGAMVVESEIPHSRFVKLTERFAGEVTTASQTVERLREVKSAEEVARISAAQKLTDEAFGHILGFIRPGVSEAEIGLELEVFMRRAGSEGVAFPPIVASGPNSALPHAKVTRRRVAPGDFVKLDFGARVDGYCADMTRTVVVGKPSAEQRRVYSAVLAANEAGIAAAVAGKTGAEIDRAARDVIVDAGYGDRFGHGLGHGVGLEVHELPSVGPRGDRPVVAGSVITIEPGVYIPGWGGVRIEDLVVVREGGCTVLTTSEKRLIEL